ncbi:MAG: hypothetical protein GF364_01420 [Candidatus Lokiarchaeota archaeon]|nr:hypothetical protein [Candidatus Lokiarchaeota archaeon]
MTNEENKKQEGENKGEDYPESKNTGKFKQTNYSTLEEALQAKLAQEKKLLGQDLTSEQRDIIDCFEKPRMVLQRIFIIYNQTRRMMGIELIKENAIRKHLDALEQNGYITIEKFEYQGQQKEAFLLTEKGKQMLE